MYAYGDGVPQDWALAVDWSRKAADQDNPWAQANYGLFLELGRAGPAGSVPGRRLVSPGGRSHGFALAQVRLGLLYQADAASPQILSAPSTSICRRRERMIRSRERLLALAFRDGIGTPPNQAEAIAWLKRASQHGDAEAMYLLSEIYARRARASPATSRPRVQYLLDAAEHGHALARRADRQRVRRDIQSCGSGADGSNTAIDRATKEADFLPEDPATYRGRQLALARYHLGMLLLDGDGIETGCRRALWRCSTMHRTMTAPVATNQLARMSHQGIGVARDNDAPRSSSMRLRHRRRRVGRLRTGRGLRDRLGGERSASIALQLVSAVRRPRLSRGMVRSRPHV